MITQEVVDLSRLQFAATAFYHFLFVPLTLGLSFLLAIMETVFVMTGKEIYRDMTKFWGKLFGINFALGVTTGITMEFQFGTNWAYYSHYVGDIFGAPLAIEGLMAFFLESTFIGLFFFGWDKLSKRQAPVDHLSDRHRLQPVGGVDPDRQRLDAEPGRLGIQLRHHAHGNDVVLGPGVQPGGAGQVRAHRLGRLCHRLHVRARHLRLVPAQGPRHRIRQALVPHRRRLRFRLGLVGDRARRRIRLRRHRTPADQARRTGSACGRPSRRRPRSRCSPFPDDEKRENRAEIKIPYALGLIATRSANKVIPGIDRARSASRRTHQERHRSPSRRSSSLRAKTADDATKASFEEHKADLGYGLLLKKYTADVSRRRRK